MLYCSSLRAGSIWAWPLLLVTLQLHLLLQHTP
jgi:hypothetical protein